MALRAVQHSQGVSHHIDLSEYAGFNCYFGELKSHYRKRGYPALRKRGHPAFDARHRGNPSFLGENAGPPELLE